MELCLVALDSASAEMIVHTVTMMSSPGPQTPDTGDRSRWPGEPGTR